MTSESEEIVWNDENNTTVFQLHALGVDDSSDNAADIYDVERNGDADAAADADAVFYVKLSDMLSVFKFRIPTEPSNDISGNLYDASSNNQ